MKAAPPIYTWQELSTITGISRRTIYLWAEIGVIPPACAVGRAGPHWSEDHVRAIRKALQVKEQQVTLRDLAERVGYKKDHA